MSYRAPLARVPFPRVKGTQAQARALTRAIGLLPLEMYPRTRSVPDEKRVSAVAQRAVLEAIAAHANGAGFSLLKVGTIAFESKCGRRTVYRALAALETQGHLERFLFKRTREFYRREGLSAHSRRGQGPNIYRVSAALRQRAGLHEVDWTPDTPKRAAGRTTQLVAYPEEESGEMPTPGHSVRGRGRPRPEPVARDEMQGNRVPAAPARGTPRTENKRKPLSKEERLALSSSDVLPSSRAATLRRAPLRNTSEMVSAFPLKEALVVIEAEGLVASGDAAWVEPGWSA